MCTSLRERKDVTFWNFVGNFGSCRIPSKWTAASFGDNAKVPPPPLPSPPFGEPPALDDLSSAESRALTRRCAEVSEFLRNQHQAIALHLPGHREDWRTRLDPLRRLEKEHENEAYGNENEIELRQ